MVEVSPVTPAGCDEEGVRVKTRLFPEAPLLDKEISTVGVPLARGSALPRALPGARQVTTRRQPAFRQD